MKTKLFAAFLLAGILAMSFAAASTCNTMVCGTVYWNTDPLTTVAGADVDVTCEGDLLSTTTASDGTYCVCYDDSNCGDGSTADVTAEKDGASGSNSGVVEDGMCGLNIGIVDVFIPEFSAIAAGIAIAGSAVGFAMLRRRK